MAPAYVGSGELGGYSPQDLQEAYHLEKASEVYGETIAIVDAYDDPNAEKDMNAYRAAYHLPTCTAASGCFKKMNQKGETTLTSLPEASESWGVEISLDLDMASAVCTHCKILLVEANNREDANLFTAEDEAAANKPTVISNSWGELEFSEETADDKYFHHEMPVVAAAGDDGHLLSPIYPAASPDVISVGGTALSKSSDSRGWSEEAWVSSGGGCSAYESKPAWQTDTYCSRRMDNDVAAVASPETPVSVYDTSRYAYEKEGTGPWMLVGGTSAATPIIAGLEALSSSEMRSKGASAFYKDRELFDVSWGANGICDPNSGEASWCTKREYLTGAVPGYDGPTGNGTPDARFGISVPLVATGPELEGTGSTAVLRGAVNPEGIETHYQFEYGPTPSYGTSVPATPASAGSGTAYVEARQTITKLKPETAYHYRLVATNGGTTTYGEDRTFTTSDWSRQVVPNVENEDELLGVSCVSSSSCTAVGGQSINSEGRTLPRKLLVEHWNGAEWSVQAASGPAGEEWSALNGTSCSAAADCMAVGTYIAGGSDPIAFADHWNGTEWSTHEAAATGQEASDFTGVSCTAPTACTAVGHADGKTSKNTLAERWNGTEWILQATPNIAEKEGVNNDHLKGVSCISASSCTAVGEYAATRRETDAMAEAWNGKEWMLQSVPTPSGVVSNGLNAVSCVSTVCMAVGKDYTVRENEHHEEIFTAHPLIERWDGTRWTIQTPPLPAGAENAEFKSVSCPTTSMCSVSGDWWSETHQVPQPLAEIWNGTEWQILTTPTPKAGFGAYVNAVSCWSVQSCIGVGLAGRSLYAGYNEVALLAELFSGPAAPTVESEGTTHVSVQEAELNATINPEGGETRYFFEYGPTTAYGWRTIEASAGWESGAANVSQLVTGLLGGTYHFRVVAANSAGTTYGRDMTFTAPPAFAGSFGSSGSGSGQLDEPADLAVDGSGDVWVADTMNARLEEWNSEGNFVRSVGSHGTGSGQFESVYGVTVDSKGNVWASDSGGDRVEEFSSEGVFQHSYGSAGSGNGQFSSPEGLAIDSKGDVFVADRGNKRVEELSSEGAFVKNIGTSGEGVLKSPTGVALDSSGNLWVSETEAARVVEFNAEGSFVRAWGTAGSEAGKIAQGDRLTVGPEGDIWLAEWGNSRVQVFTPAGEYVFQFGGYGSGNGQFWHARGIAIHGSTVYALDSGEYGHSTNNRIEQWSRFE